jgi:hypothetical protein
MEKQVKDTKTHIVPLIGSPNLIVVPVPIRYSEPDGSTT